MLAKLVRVVPIATALSALVLSGCLETSWDRARRADTVAAYHQFLRDHPGSGHTNAARERIAYLRLLTNPTVEMFEAFEAEFPTSRLLPEVRGVVEPFYFEEARQANTPAAYRAYLRYYPDGDLAARARGNLEYVERVRVAPTITGLREFVARHPKSDFAAEAEATLRLLEVHRATGISALSLQIDVSANVAEADRVRRGFAAVVARAYEPLGIGIFLTQPGDPLPAGVDGWIRVDYAEKPAPGTFGRSNLVSDCRVRLYRRGQEEPIWDREFLAPAEHLGAGARGRDKTVFGNAGYAFWDEFFVPVSSWSTDRSRVARLEYSEPVLAIDVAGDRAAVLLNSGGFEYFDVSTAMDPKRLLRHRRSRDLTKWTGLRVLPDDRLVVYGTNGAELLDLSSGRAVQMARWEAGELGGVRDAGVFRTTLLLVGNRGLHAVRYGTSNLMPHKLVEADLVGLEIRDPYVYLIGPGRLEVATPKQLLSHITGAKIPLGEQFKARKSRLIGDSIYVVGQSKIVEFSLWDPEKPIPVSKVESEDVGEVADVSADGEHLYLLGARGLQVAGPAARWVSDFIQVPGSGEMEARGRFVIVAGEQSVDVVDLSPYQLALARPAAVRPSAGESAPAAPAEPEPGPDAGEGPENAPTLQIGEEAVIGPGLDDFEDAPPAPEVEPE